jgi:hypothetical protein
MSVETTLSTNSFTPGQTVCVTVKSDDGAPSVAVQVNGDTGNSTALEVTGTGQPWIICFTVPAEAYSVTFVITAGACLTEEIAVIR